MKKLIATTALALIIGGPAVSQATDDQTTQPQADQDEATTAQTEQPEGEAGQTEAAQGQQPEGEAGQTETAQDQQQGGQAAQAETADTQAQPAGQQGQQSAGGGFYQPQESDVFVSELMDAQVYAPQGGQQQGGQQQTGQQQAGQQAGGATQPEGEQETAEVETEGEQATTGEAETPEGGQAQQTAGATGSTGAMMTGGGQGFQVEQMSQDQVGDMANIGQVTDIVVGEQGEVQAVVVEVGGFLGVGAREVAMSVDQLQFGQSQDDESEFFVITQVQADQLEQAPEFQRAEAGQQGQQTAQTGAQQQETGQQQQPQQETAQTGNQQQTTGQAAGAAATAAAGGAAATAGSDMTPGTGEAETDEAEVVVIQEGEGEETTDQQEVEVGTATDEAPTDDAQMGEGGVPVTATDEGWRRERDVMVAPAMQREGYSEVTAGEITVDNLMGANVYDTNDENVGSVSDVVMDDTGSVQYAVIDVGGFLGLGTRSVAIGFDEMQVMQAEGGDDLRVYVDVTQEQLESMPEYESAAN